MQTQNLSERVLQDRFEKRVKGARTALSAYAAGFWGNTLRTWLSALLLEFALWVLQENSDLSARSWTEVTATPTVTNLQAQVTVSAPVSNHF